MRRFFRMNGMCSPCWLISLARVTRITEVLHFAWFFMNWNCLDSHLIATTPYLTVALLTEETFWMCSYQPVQVLLTLGPVVDLDSGAHLSYKIAHWSPKFLMMSRFIYIWLRRTESKTTLSLFSFVLCCLCQHSPSSDQTFVQSYNFHRNHFLSYCYVQGERTIGISRKTRCSVR